MKLSKLLTELNIPFKRVGVGYYILDNGKELMLDEETVYFQCGNIIDKRSIYQKTIKRIIRAFYRGKRIEKGEY